MNANYQPAATSHDLLWSRPNGKTPITSLDAIRNSAVKHETNLGSTS